MSSSLDVLGETLVLGALLKEVHASYGEFDLLDHWKQGEFHHDVLLRLATPGDLPGPILVVATNCNGGVKEILCFGEVPDRGALWHYRCPNVADFRGEMPSVLGRTETLHWFDPCDLLAPDARSEYRPEFRKRQEGGGWVVSGLPEIGAEKCG